MLLRFLLLVGLAFSISSFFAYAEKSTLSSSQSATQNIYRTIAARLEILASDAFTKTRDQTDALNELREALVGHHETLLHRVPEHHQPNH